MNERVKQLIKQAGTDVSGKWISVEKAELLVNLAVQQCVLAVEMNTNTHHIHTTYDQDLVITTINKSARAIRELFGIKEPYNIDQFDRLT